VNNNDRKKDRFYYRSSFDNNGNPDRVGLPMQLGGKSNGAYWKCVNGQQNAGYAYNMLSYRWPTENNANRLLDAEFQFNRVNDLDTNPINIAIRNNTLLKVTFAFTIENVEDSSIAANLLKFELMGRSHSSDTLICVNHYSDQNTTTKVASLLV
jgi:hypothetical protein